jgi:hypothetical protein
MARDKPLNISLFRRKMSQMKKSQFSDLFESPAAIMTEITAAGDRMWKVCDAYFNRMLRIGLCILPRSDV